MKAESPPFPPDMEKFNEEASAPEDKNLRKEFEDNLKEDMRSKIKPKKLNLERFVRFDLLETETI